VSIDLTAAFDFTDRVHVIREMKRYKVPHNITKWLADIITERRIKVDYKSATSKVRHTISEVSQGTVLAPFNYNVASNGAIEIVLGEPLVECRNYADDAVFIIRGKNKDAMRLSTSAALSRTTRWYKEDGFQNNPYKCFYTIITFTHTSPTLELFIDGKKIREEENLVYLGVTLDKKLPGKAHFQKAAEKAKKRIRLMQSAAGVSLGASLNKLMLTYRTYVKPILEYGTEVFATTTDNHIEILNKVQNQALRIASVAVKTTPIVAMEAYCKVEPLLQ